MLNVDVEYIFSTRSQCCVHNGTLYEVGSNIENNSEECEKVKGRYIVADFPNNHGVCAVPGHFELPDG